MVRRFTGVLALLLATCLIAACSSLSLRTPVPKELQDVAAVPGLPNVRYWGDELPDNIDALVAQHSRQIVANHLQRGNFLALSGGGGDGAFGAGLLVGWTASGTRPEFEVVTGISTGALIAPFAFLGPAYDRKLNAVYTSYGTTQIASFNILGGLLGGVAITEDSQLKELIAKFVPDDVIAAIAREHMRGRRLLVGTTNLDSQRPVVWDMGAIAASGAPDAPQLFRDVLLASASVPGLFPPVFIDVTAAGQKLQEMHVDGGTTAEVFFLPPELIRMADAGNSMGHRPNLYVISNGKLGPEYKPVAANTFSIVKRSVQTLIKSQWSSDLVGLYIGASEAGMVFHLASVPTSFDKVSSEPFDRDYMRALFRRGYELGRSGHPWADRPPGAIGY